MKFEINTDLSPKDFNLLDDLMGNYDTKHISNGLFYYGYMYLDNVEITLNDIIESDLVESFCECEFFYEEFDFEGFISENKLEDNYRSICEM